MPGPYVNAKLSVDLTITPQALATLRTASIGGVPAGTANLALGESTITDPLSVACSAGAGNNLSSALGSLSATPGVSIQATLQLQVGSSVANPDYPDTDPNPVVYLPPLAVPSFPFATVNTSIPTSGAGATFDFGGGAGRRPADHGRRRRSVRRHRRRADRVRRIGHHGGLRQRRLHWEFSDGGQRRRRAAEPHVRRQRHATRARSPRRRVRAVTPRHFSVTVLERGAGGRRGWEREQPVGSAVSFAGTATDPSSVDQATLEYTWAFGDGSPTAAAAAGTATHVYTVPGIYDATLTVCDKDGGCTVDDRQITVAAQQQRQPTLLVYFGDLIGRTNSTSDMRAILVDRNLRPMPGRTVTFTIGGQTVSATTDSRGVASTTLKVTQRRGLYTVSATWRPGGTDAQQYTGASMTLPFLVLP